MKTYAIIPMILGFLFLVGCGSGEQAEEIPAIEYATETIKMETVKCQMCVATVQQAAANVPGVEGMRVDFDNKIGTVSFNPELTTLEEIEQAIAAAGYHANDTKRDEDVFATLPDCCR